MAVRGARRFGLVLLSLAAAASAWAPSAGALPGDSPIVALTPADGASVPAGPAVVTVTYRCPDYRAAVYDDGDGHVLTDLRDASDYNVRFSTSPALDANGALARTDFGGIRSANPVGDGTCASALDSFDGGTYSSAVGRRVYWQAYRYCNGCTPQDEKGPVRSFFVRPTRIVARLSVPRRLYAGYPALLAVETSAEPGSAEVRLQYRRGATWRTFATHGFVSKRTELVGTLPAGRHSVRALLAARSFSQVVATRTLTVRRAAGRSTSARDDGRYAARDRRERRTSTLTFRIANRGRTLRDFKASVTTFCVGPTLEDNHLYVAQRGARRGEGRAGRNGHRLPGHEGPAVRAQADRPRAPWALPWQDRRAVLDVRRRAQA